MSDFRPMPQHLDWGKLISLLRATYTHGDGGLPVGSGISPDVLTDGCVKGVHSWRNGVTLWNLAVDKLAPADIEDCIVDEPERLAG